MYLSPKQKQLIIALEIMYDLETLYLNKNVIVLYSYIFIKHWTEIFIKKQT